MPKEQCKLKNKFLSDFRFKGWLAAAGSDKKAKCLLCQTEFSVTYGVESAILNHAGGLYHKKIVKN